MKENLPARLIYVEDNSDDAFIFKLVSKNLFPDCEVVWLKDGEELFDYLNNKNNFKNRIKQHAVHLIIMDINMPKISGMEALKLIKNSKNSELLKVPIIMLSTSARQEDIVNCETLGTANYIVKPHLYDELVIVLKELMQKHIFSQSPLVTCI